MDVGEKFRGDLMYKIDLEHCICLDEGIFLDTDKQAVIRYGLPIYFSKIEFRLLSYFIRNMNRPISHQELTDYVWGARGFIEKEELAVYINRIRKKIEPHPREPKYLVTVKGFGYIFSQK